jgi:hypothetical protein
MTDAPRRRRDRAAAAGSQRRHQFPPAPPGSMLPQWPLPHVPPCGGGFAFARSIRPYYMRLQVTDHSPLLWVIAPGENADLQRLASDTLPGVLHHLQLAQGLVSQLTGAARPTRLCTPVDRTRLCSLGRNQPDQRLFRQHRSNSERIAVSTTSPECPRKR